MNLATLETAFGAASRRAIEERWAEARRAQPEVADATLLDRIVADHRATFGDAKLAAELADELARDHARTDDAALVAYEARWRKRLARLQRVHPARWRVPGWSDEELRDELLLRLVVAVRLEPGADDARARPGKEWGLLVLAGERRALRKKNRLEIVLVDPKPARDRSPTGEDRLLDLEEATLREQARVRAEAGLTIPQRRWLSAMKLSANAGAFFASSGELNLAAAARVLDKNRSSAVRAFDELQRVFGRERSAIDPDDD